MTTINVRLFPLSVIYVLSDCNPKIYLWENLFYKTGILLLHGADCLGHSVDPGDSLAHSFRINLMLYCMSKK